jgi:Glycosyltransferase family 6
MKDLIFVVLATNSYLPLGIRLYKNLCRYFHGDFHVNMIVNEDPNPYLSERFLKNISFFDDNNTSWVDCMYLKFKWMLAAEAEFIYYLDADTNINRSVDKSLFCNTEYQLVGAEHFGNRSWMKEKKAYERNPISPSYIPFDTPLPQMYYQGAFFGGKKEKVDSFCKTIQGWKAQDKTIGFEPGVNDESYINNYFHYNPPHAILLENFPFSISDKGGLQGTRYVKNPWDKQGLMNNRDNYINIFDGKIMKAA